MLSGCLILVAVPILVLGAPAKENVVDMTHDLQENIPSFPGHTKYNFTIMVRGKYKLLDDLHIELNTILLSEHTATHVDAPAHFGGKIRMHQILPKDMIGPGVVIDIRDKAEKDMDAEILVEDLLKYEKKYGRIPDRSFVFCYSGWQKYWPDRDAYLGSKSYIVGEFHSPGFSLEATKWLVENRDIIGIGGDAMSFEKGHTKIFPVHQYLLREKNRLGFEMVANLDKVPAAGSTIYAFPMKIYDGSGAPVRMMAILNGSGGLMASIQMISLFAVSALYYLLR